MPAFQAQTPCPACGHAQASSVCEVDGKTGQALHTVVCLSCGLGRIDPLPTPDALEAWYRDAYRQDYKASVQPKMRHVLRAGRNMRDRWLWLREHMDALPARSRTLDVGASSGECVFMMKHLGYEAMGIEPHTGYANYAREQLGLDIRHGSLREHVAQLPRQSLHLITMFHVLEHFVDPLQALASYRELLAPGGTLYIEVPGSTRLCGPKTLFFKAHTLHFTGPSMRAVLERAGFEIVALDAPWDGNIRVLARARASAQPIQAWSWAYDDSMLRAARSRTLPRYIAQEIGSLGAVRKLARNIEERRSGKRFASASDCLRDVYAALA